MFDRKKMQWIAVFLMASSICFANDVEDIEALPVEDALVVQVEPVEERECTECECNEEETFSCEKETCGEEAFAEEAISQVVNVNEMTDEDLLLAVEGKAILEFPAESQLALQLCVDGEVLSFFGFSDDIGCLEVQETFYLKFPKEGGLLFSSDLSEWKPFFDFTTGNLSLFLAKEEDTLVLNIDLLLNKRSA